jgi:hypothetical protein
VLDDAGPSIDPTTPTIRSDWPERRLEFKRQRLAASCRARLPIDNVARPADRRQVHGLMGLPPIVSTMTPVVLFARRLGATAGLRHGLARVVCLPTVVFVESQSWIGCGERPGFMTGDRH